MGNYLGLDPSSLSTGWAVVDEDKELLDYGIIEGRTDNPKSFILLHDRLDEIIKEHNIKAVFIEDTFFSRNVDTLKKLVRPTGIILYMVGIYELKHQFIMPASWRKTFIGNGRTSKRETYEYVNDLYKLGFDSFNKYNDLTDAIGVAWACAEEFGNEI